jgi:hypothetical protein
MDYHDLQRKLFAIEPSNPAEDLAKLQAMGGGAAQSAPAVPQPVAESYEVAEGSLQMDRDYSITDFAALAGVVTEGKQRTGSAGQAKGKDPMPKAEPGRTKHPLQDKLVGESSEDRIAALEARVAQLEEMLSEKAVSKKQQRFMGMVHAAQKGEEPASPEVAKVAKDMKKKDALDFAKTKHKGLPNKKKSESVSIKDELMARLAEYELRK